MKKKITQINEAARKRLGITRDEYALCSYVQYRQADRRGRAGWCVDPKKDVAEFVGITRPGLYKMLDRLEEKNLLFIEPATGAVQVTEHWIDTENERKQSLHDGVNKVDTKRKQSLHDGVNKVTPIKERIKREKEELSVNARAKNALPLETETPLSENEAGGGGAAQNPPSPESVAYTTDPAELEMLLRTYYMARPDDWKVIKERLDRAAAQVGKKYDKEKIADVVSRYCDWTITKGHTGWTFSQHHSRLRMWMGDQPSRETPAQTTTTAPAAVRKTMPTYGN